MELDNQTFTDAVKVGLVNVVIYGFISKVLPNNIPAQMFISAVLVHYTIEKMRNEDIIKS